MKTFGKSLMVVAMLAAGGAALAQEPAQNIGMRHGNLRAAQDMVRQAFDDVTNAQIDNGYDLGGHAGRAKELLREASDELKMAAQTANSNER
jgi:hypothetical protein